MTLFQLATRLTIAIIFIIFLYQTGLKELQKDFHHFTSDLQEKSHVEITSKN